MTATSVLSVVATEKVMRLSELYEIGTDTFGNSQSFISCISLGDKKPVWLIESGVGVEYVKDELLRLQYGLLCWSLPTSRIEVTVYPHPSLNLCFIF
jgi:uncharacterized protein (DUF2384 family)